MAILRRNSATMWVAMSISATKIVLEQRLINYVLIISAKGNHIRLSTSVTKEEKKYIKYVQTYPSYASIT